MKFVALFAVAALSCFTTEIFPTTIRATGSGVAAGFARLAGIITPLFAGVTRYSLTHTHCDPVGMIVLCRLQHLRTLFTRKHFVRLVVHTRIHTRIAGALLDVWPTSLLLITGVTSLAAVLCIICLPADSETRGVSIA